MFAACKVIQFVAEIAVVGSGHQINRHADKCDICNRSETAGEAVASWTGGQNDAGLSEPSPRGFKSR